MPQVILNDDESNALARAVGHFVLRNRTGQLGIFHGMDRFVSTKDRLKKKDIEHLESALSKLGVRLKTE